jgi:hypothetical protein
MVFQRFVTQEHWYQLFLAQIFFSVLFLRSIKSEFISALITCLINTDVLNERMLIKKNHYWLSNCFCLFRNASRVASESREAMFRRAMALLSARCTSVHATLDAFLKRQKQLDNQLWFFFINILSFKTSVLIKHVIRAEINSDFIDRKNNTEKNIWARKSWI